MNEFELIERQTNRQERRNAIKVEEFVRYWKTKQFREQGRMRKLILDGGPQAVKNFRTNTDNTSYSSVVRGVGGGRIVHALARQDFTHETLQLQRDKATTEQPWPSGLRRRATAATTLVRVPPWSDQ